MGHGASTLMYCCSTRHIIKVNLSMPYPATQLATTSSPQTQTPRVFVSTHFQGTWMFITADDIPYIFCWNHEHQVWFCTEYGIGLYENNPEDKCEQACSFFHADFSLPCFDKQTHGPRRVEIKGNSAGPYWHATVAECMEATTKQYEENQKAMLQQEMEYKQQLLCHGVFKQAAFKAQVFIQIEFGKCVLKA
jgi:hypothetical protein